MVKFFRKYNRIIMVGFGSVLMLAFLAPQSIQQFGQNQANRAIGTINGQAVTAAMLADAAREREALSLFSPALFTRVLGVNPQAADHWFLLSREAELAGFVGHSADGAEWMGQLTEGLADMMARDQFNISLNQSPQIREFLMQQMEQMLTQGRLQAMSRTRMTEEEFNQLLSKARGVFRMMQSYERTPRFSDRRALIAAKNDLDSATFEYVFVPASAIAHEIAEPSDAELAAFFEKHKTTPRGSGELGIGYTFPPRVKLEWMTLRNADFASAVAPDPIEVQKRYRADRTKYAGEFTAEKPRIEADIRAEIAGKAMEEASSAIRTEVLKVTRKLEPDGDYLKLPADWEQTRPTLEQIAGAVVEQVKTRLNLTIGRPEVNVRSSAFLTGEELSQLPGIGASTVRFGGQSRSFADSMLSVRELGGSSPLNLQVGLPLVAFRFTNDAGDRFYATVLEARRTSPPDSWEEIRELVTADFRLAAAFERLKAEAGDLKVIAEGGGLKAVADAFNARRAPAAEGAAQAPELTVQADQQASREQSFAPDQAVNTAEVRDGLLDIADALDPLADIKALPVAGRVLVKPVSGPSGAGLVAAMVTGRRPLTSETLRLAGEGSVRRAQSQEYRATLNSPADFPFSYEALRTRHVLKIDGREEPRSTPAGGASGEANTQG